MSDKTILVELYDNDNTAQNKIADHEVDDLYNIWLGRMFWNITFTPLSDDEVKTIRELLREENVT